ncbi:MAG: hypothetical protein NC225_07845 [Clostridium sp.]|nr:hypothetical protein [Clostridium sp.]MCM1460583.1 hypothetical protein [Bacteroides sp.]
MRVTDFGEEFVKWLQIVKDEIEGTNDRSVVIVCAAILDTQLEKLIKNVLYIDKNIDENLFMGGNAILSSFSAKITMAYYMKIISKDELDLLNAIRKLRNKFAHEIDVSKGRISDSIKDNCLNLTIPKGMYVPMEAFVGNINDLDLSYNPNDEKEPMKRFINTFYFLTQCLFLHNLEFLDIIDDENSAYITPKPYEFIELFRDLLQRENDVIEEYLQICMEKAKEDSETLENVLITFQDGDVFKYRNEEIKSKDRIKECIEILKEDYINFENELKHRITDSSNEKETLFGNNYETTCDSIQELTALAEKIKKISK